jgi:hypothetical protein
MEQMPWRLEGQSYQCYQGEVKKYFINEVML